MNKKSNERRSGFTPMPERRTNDFAPTAHRRLARGFTLIEILVVAGIVAMLSSYAVIYSGISRRQIALSIEAQKVANFIFRARSNAILTTVGSSSNLCGYGARFNISGGEYAFFEYGANSSGPPCPTPGSISPGRMIILETSSLPQGIIFESRADSLGSVLFIPPAPKTYMSLAPAAGGLSPGPARVYLSTADGSRKVVVVVGGFGQISFE